VIPSTNVVLYHVILSICFLPCDAFKMCYTMWYLQTVYTIWYIQTILCHVIPSNCFMPCDIFKLLYDMWYIQTVWYHMMHSSCFITYATFNMFYIM
jgi:hypothetical protein